MTDENEHIKVSEIKMTSTMTTKHNNNNNNNNTKNNNNIFNLMSDIQGY
jgi:hypothetical protein